MYLICICNFWPWGSNVFRKFTLGLVFWLNGWPSWHGNFFSSLQCQFWRLILDSENKILFPGTLAKLIPALPLVSAALGKWWCCELRESRCSWAALSEIPEPRCGLKVWQLLHSFIIILSTLFNLLALFQTCDIASGELWPVQRHTGGWRESRAGPPRWEPMAHRECQCSLVRRRVDVLLSLSSLTQCKSEKKENLRGAQQKGLR